MCDQIAHRFPHSTPDSDAREVANQKLSLLPAILKRNSTPLLTSPKYWPWWWVIVTLLITVVPGAVLALVTSSDQQARASYLHFFLGGIGLFVSTVIYLLIGVSDLPAESRFAWKCYTMGMRQQLVLFLQCYPLPAASIYAALRTFQLGSARANHLLGQIERDFALRFYSTAVWFLR
jgi:hypothetical protein